MARPAHDHPTPAELEVLQVIWARDHATVRDVMDVLNQHMPRAYTTVMTLMNVMVRKKILVRRKRGRAFVYRARKTCEQTLGAMVADLLGRAFQGSVAAMVECLIDQVKPGEAELKAVRDVIARRAGSGSR